MKAKRFILALAAIMTFATWNAAQAVTFTISDVQFAKSGDTETPLAWNVSSGYTGATTLVNNVAAGSSWTFIYGTFNLFNTTIINSVGTDADDYFGVDFKIQPPTPAHNNATIGYLATIKFNPNQATVSVDFNNDPYIVDFGNTGKYEVTFQDASKKLNSTASVGSDANNLDLYATIKLVSDVTTTAPIPEPGTIVLLGAGLFGLAVYGKRRMNKA